MLFYSIIVGVFKQTKTKIKTKNKKKRKKKKKKIESKIIMVEKYILN